MKVMSIEQIRKVVYGQQINLNLLTQEPPNVAAFLYQENDPVHRTHKISRHGIRFRVRVQEWRWITVPETGILVVIYPESRRRVKVTRQTESI